MTAARACAARLRGGFVGATSATVAVGAHSVNASVPPNAGSVLLVVLACAVIGMVATTVASDRGPVAVLAFVGGGQLIGHCMLVFASGHTHGGHWSAAMLASHVIAAVGCTVMICAAERLCTAAANELRRLIVVVLGVDESQGPSRPSLPPLRTFVSRILVGSPLGTRAPPPAAMLA